MGYVQILQRTSVYAGSSKGPHVPQIHPHVLMYTYILSFSRRKTGSHALFYDFRRASELTRAFPGTRTVVYAPCSEMKCIPSISTARVTVSLNAIADIISKSVSYCLYYRKVAQFASYENIVNKKIQSSYLI